MKITFYCYECNSEITIEGGKKTDLYKKLRSAGWSVGKFFRCERCKNRR